MRFAFRRSRAVVLVFLAFAVIPIPKTKAQGSQDKLAGTPANVGHTTEKGSLIVARVGLAGPPETYPLPVHALLQDGAGQDYLVVFATRPQLNHAGWPWRALAANCAPEECVLATELRANARETAGPAWNAFLDDGRRWLLRASAEQVEALAELGFAVQRLDSEPITWPPLPQFRKDGGPSRTIPSALVSEMIGTVQTTNLYSLLARLTGQESVLAGGGPYLLRTRHTASGIVLTNGLEVAYNRLQALGLAPSFYLWSSGSYTNRNVVANLPGTVRSNEIVLVTAHLDDMPSGTTAPGADDNASGCVAVLAAAGVCAQYEFERTIRFALFTGEEQGLLGSARYAAAVQAAGENVAAVLNLDMIGWDGTPPPKFQLHTRTTASIGYSNDLAIASTFTNVVSAYGLSSMLTNVVIADGITASDHSSFWNRGYAAALAIEDYGGDFNPYYHTTGDTLQRINLPYFKAAVKASLGTVAHLAGPVNRRPGVDVIELAASDWNPASGIRAHAFVARHLNGATEGDQEPLDTLAVPVDPLTASLRLGSYPYGLELWADSRPCDSESVFNALLELVSPGPVSFTNKLRLEFLTAPGADRVYLARVHTDLPEPSGFLCITNIRELAAYGHYLALPPLTNSFSARLGSCEVTCRFLDKSPTGCPLRLVSADDSHVSLSTSAQVGVTIVDQVEYTTNLAAEAWTRTATYTNQIAPTPDNFDSGWVELARTVDVSGLPPSAGYYFRLNRTWLAP